MSRYRLDVVASSIIDVVRCAGGWMFDRGVAGWDVTVLVEDRSDALPLRILGAEMLELEPVLAAGGYGRVPQALAVDAELCAREPRAREGVQRALEHGGIEVVVWGDGWPAARDHGVDPVLHQLSGAAQAFKSRAVAASAGPMTTVSPTEVFRSRMGVDAPVGADFSPAS